MAPHKQSRPWHREAMVSLGFSCFLATMLLYSAAAMPFQRFATLPGFVNAFSVSLQTAAAAGFIMALLCVCKRTRHLLAHRLVCGLGVASYLAGNAMFCTMALFGAGPAGLVCATGCLVGLGSVLQCRAWGSMLAAFDLRRATSVVAASAIAAALIGWAQLALPPAGAVALFMACSAVSAALPLKPTPTDQNPACATYRLAAEQTAAPFGTRIRAFLDIALVPSIGLALFAMMMGMRGELFFDDYPHYVAVQVVVAALLFVCTLLPTHRPLMQAIYRGLVPALATVVLMANYLGEALLGGSRLETTLVILLYSVAALLTLSTLAGMAHAGDFPCDLISSLAVGTFALVTVATQQGFSALGLDDDAARKLIMASSALYAGGMIVLAIWRGLRTGETPQSGETSILRVRRQSGAEQTDAIDALGPTVDERCDILASQHALTGREREVLSYLAHGHSAVYIGDELVISPNTVRTHIHNIYRKLGVNTREDILLLVHGRR